MGRDRDEKEAPVGWGRALLPIGVIFVIALLLVVGSLIYRAAS